MTSIPIDQAPRLARFNENELHLIRGALVSFASDIVADAEGEEIATEDLEAAGATFAQAMALAHEVDDQLGVEHPPFEQVVTIAQVIAEGDAPLASKMAREAADCGRCGDPPPHVLCFDPECPTEAKPTKAADLVGRTVEAIAVSADGETLYLRCDDDHVLSLPTEGDCCSTTWWNDVISPKQILGATVTAIESIELPDPERPGRYECLQDYGLKVTTDRGACTLVYRNESNGYYGGSHWATWIDAVPADVTYVTEDWSA